MAKFQADEATVSYVAAVPTMHPGGHHLYRADVVARSLAEDAMRAVPHLMLLVGSALFAARVQALCVLPQYYVCEPAAVVLVDSVDSVVETTDADAATLRVTDIFVIDGQLDAGTSLEDAGALG